MRIRHCGVGATIVLLAITTGCGGGGGGGGGDIRRGGLPQGTLPDLLSIQTQWPLDGDLHIPRDATIVVHFDAALHPECILDGLTYLEDGDGNRVRANFSLKEENHTLVVDPDGSLAPETWYTCHLSPLLCDLAARLLEEDLYFSFQTVDATAPSAIAFSHPVGASDVPRDVTLRIDFNEPLDTESLTATTVSIRDTSGAPQPTEHRFSEKSLFVQVVRDLLPAQAFTLEVTGGPAGVRDLAGHPMASSISRGFRTTSRNDAPKVVDIDPGSGTVSPNSIIAVTYDASMDVAKASVAAFSFRDDLQALVQFTMESDPTGRVVRLRPKQPLLEGRVYTVITNTTESAIRSLGGVAPVNSLVARFSVGSDSRAPELIRSSPGDRAVRVSPRAVPVLEFDEALDRTRVHNETVELADEDGPLSFVSILSANGSTIMLKPVTPFEAGHEYVITLRGGAAGIRDIAGNTLAEDLRITFFTSTDTTLPTATISPTHGHSAVSPHSTFTAAFDEPLDPSSVSTSSVVVTDPGNRIIPGTVTLSHANRIITFFPTTPYPSGEWVSVTLRDGETGIREATGNWLERPIRTSFRTSFATDIVPPTVNVTLNEIRDRRKVDLAVPPFGFELSVTAEDPVNSDVDLGSYSVEVTGPATGLDPVKILSGAKIRKNRIDFRVASTNEWPAGDYTVRARVDDMAGNEGVSEVFAFRVVGKDAGVMPFEKTQVVWVRFDLDRDGNGRADSEDDLLRLGLISDGDPAGTNQRMIDLMREGILSQAHQIFERKTNGGRTGPDSIPLLFTATQPRGIAFSQIAFGGLDPQSPPGRTYSQKSSGILGRAFFDDRNASHIDDNTSTQPGLGIFGGELFLFEAETHQSLYPLFVTSFARRFTKVCRPMGGTPVGSHSADAKVVAPEFDLATATSIEKARYYDIFLAADDWASATSVILAHETGHTVGLVMTGPPPVGLHGDASLHNSYSNLGDVMSAAVGYDSLINLKYRFRDLSRAYLRQRILLK